MYPASSDSIIHINSPLAITSYCSADELALLVTEASTNSIHRIPLR